ncbi:MAG: 50S ribosomal protein L29 [Desulfurococcaceae archaeon]
MKPDEIRKMSPEERVKKLEELRLELLKLRMQAKMGLLKDTARIRNTRRSIARILTIINEERRKQTQTTSEGA